MEALGEYYRGLLLDERSPSFSRRVSEVSARLGDSERSLEFANRALAADSSDAHSQWLAGTALLNLGRDREALAVLVRATAEDSSEAEYFRALGRAAERMDRIDLAASAYAQVVLLDDDDGESWFQLAASDARLGRFHEAEAALAEAVERNPIRPGVLFLQGWIQESLGRPEKAIDLYREHLKVHDADLATRRRLVGLLAQQKRYPEAYVEAKRVAKERPDDLEAVAVEADLAYRVGKKDEAQKIVDRMRAEHPGDPEVMALALGLMAKNGQSTRAATIARDWVAEDPNDAARWIAAARVYEMGKRSDEAKSALDRAVELAPDSLQPRVLLARFLQDHDRLNEAEKTWSAASQHFPDVNALRFDLALCREKLGDIPGAEAAARDALAHDPDNPTALNFLGYLLADHNLKLDEAAGLIQKALRQDPDNGAYLDSLGWVYYRLGRLTEAREQLEQALVVLGGDPVVHEHLGDVYKDMRLFKLAKEQYEKSLTADRASARVKAKLESLR
jgi:tetratricopeptide (TPR) repeat protein